MTSKRVQFLTTDETVAIHERLRERFGGRSGVRDMGELEAALYRPRTGHYGDLVGMATALFASLMQAAPFVDGNKRLAFFATDTFLRMNGYRMAVEPEMAQSFLDNIAASGRYELEYLQPQLRAVLVRDG